MEEDGDELQTGLTPAPFAHLPWSETSFQGFLLQRASLSSDTHEMVFTYDG